MAPVLPFFCEYLFQRLMVDTGLCPAGESVHLRRFPEVDDALLDLELERSMQSVRDVVGLGLQIREREKLGVRRPLEKVTVASRDAGVRDAVTRIQDAILGELNVKQVEVLADDSSLCRVSAKPNFRTLGKRLGPKLKAVQARLGALTAADIARLEQAGSLELEGETLTVDDVLLTREASVAGAVESRGGITVLLDTQISPALHAEGLARELVNRIQNLRKDAKLDVSQRIRLVLSCDGALGSVATHPLLKDLIARETLAVAIEHRTASDAPGGCPFTKDDVIDGEPVTIGLAPAS